MDALISQFETVLGPQVFLYAVTLSPVLLAFVFGAGTALTLDEFALILHLEDVYWLEEGRISVDAVVVVTAAGALSLLTGPPLVGADLGKSSIWWLTTVALVNLTFAVISIVKGKLWTGFVGIWVPVLAFFGAVRLARPNSPWARARYAARPKTMARARAREDRRRGRAGRFRDWFYDLIAGKPSLPPFGPGADDFTSVAYWYQEEPHQPFGLQPYAERAAASKAVDYRKP